MDKINLFNILKNKDKIGGGKQSGSDLQTPAPSYAAVAARSPVGVSKTILLNTTIKEAVKTYKEPKTIEKYGRIEDWDTSEVTSMRRLFKSNLTFNEDISKWNTGNVKDMRAMFKNAKKFNQDISKWNTSKVIHMTNMFTGAKEFNQNINTKEVTVNGGTYVAWDTRQVINMSYMFQEALIFNQPLDEWNTSNVRDMSYMFDNALIFNQPINKWNTGNVSDMSYMFDTASNFNQPLDKWNTSNVNYMRGMFKNTSQFNQNINEWDTKNVTNMCSMFNGAIKFNQPLFLWVTDSVRYMNLMFYKAANFNQNLQTLSFKFYDDISETEETKVVWNVGHVYEMNRMFEGASKFVGNIKEWDVTAVVDLKKSSIFNNLDGYPQTPEEIYNYFYDDDIICTQLADESVVNKCSYDFPDLKDNREELFVFEGPEKEKNTGKGKYVCIEYHQYYWHPYRLSSKMQDYIDLEFVRENNIGFSIDCFVEEHRPALAIFEKKMLMKNQDQRRGKSSTSVSPDRRQREQTNPLRFEGWPTDSEDETDDPRDHPLPSIPNTHPRITPPSDFSVTILENKDSDLLNVGEVDIEYEIFVNDKIVSSFNLTIIK